LIGELYRLVDRPEYRAMVKHVSAFFSREVLGNPTINSADFALRKLDQLKDGGDLGQFAIQTGQDFLRNVNELIQPLRESLSGSFNAIAKDPAAQIQFNDIYKSLQKLPKDEQGRILFDPDSGKFVTATDDAGLPTHHLRYVRENKFAPETIEVNNADLRNFFINDWPKVQDMLWN